MGSAACRECGSADTYVLKRADGASVRICNGCLHLEVLGGG